MCPAPLGGMSQNGPVPSGGPTAWPVVGGSDTGRKARFPVLPSLSSSHSQSQNSPEAPPPGHWGLGPSSHLQGWETTKSSSSTGNCCQRSQEQGPSVPGSQSFQALKRLHKAQLASGDQGGLGMGEAHLTLGALTRGTGSYGSRYPETIRVLAPMKQALTSGSSATFHRGGAVGPRQVRGLVQAQAASPWYDQDSSSAPSAVPGPNHKAKPPHHIQEQEHHPAPGDQRGRAGSAGPMSPPGSQDTPMQTFLVHHGT